ncbi:MAG: histidine kinase [Lachnospiraceae bacterium]|nr:histidine kinase [Lachnospiraceae bacterium]
MKQNEKKDKGLIRRFLLIMGLFSISLVMLWIGFYSLTASITRSNMKQQVETWSESVISEVEEELLILEDAAYELKHNESIIRMTAIDDEMQFYESGGRLSADDALITRNLKNTDNAIVFNGNGVFYRLKGMVSNTLLNRAYFLMKNGTDPVITLMSNGSAYIGSYEAVMQDNAVTGYVLILTEQSRIERLLSEYNELDYINTALYSKDRLLCSNRQFSEEEIAERLEDAIISKEFDIGLSGFRMLVFCDDTLAKPVTGYFRIILPFTVVILVVVMIFFAGYLRKHMIEPINSVIANSLENRDAPLPSTGEVYFDGLVDHVNDMLVRIEDREKALYESEMKLKEADLEKERTLVSLLKKQINAHFTVNTLNVVRALIYKGEKEQAARICDELSTLLRYANAGDEYISLLEEFYVLEQYLGIMKVRYPGTIEEDIDEDDSFADIYIPRMLLQPIVENAIVHGLGGRKGMIRIGAHIDGEEAVISIEDDGKGMDASEVAELTDEINSSDSDVSSSQIIQHIALKNIQKRIKMVCGESYGMIISSEPGRGTRVDVHLPARAATR